MTHLALRAILALAVVGTGTGPTAFRPAPRGYRWSFPADHWSHPGYRTEWWYLTGTLEARGEPRRPLGFQLTFFRLGLSPELPDLDSSWTTRDLIMGHLAVSDPAHRRHLFSEVLYRTTPLLGGFGAYPDPTLAWSRGPLGTADLWELCWNGDGFDVSVADREQGLELVLRTHSTRPPALHGDEGWSAKASAPDAATLYYSLTRLETEGTLRIGDESLEVRGTAWMDKEIGSNVLREEQVGWDWMGLRLDDGRDLMLFQLRRRDGSVDFQSLSVVEPDGRTRALGAEDFRLEPERHWRSPATGARYPTGFRVRIPREGLDLRVVPWMDDQENRGRLTPGLFYWEGAVSVLEEGGTPVGSGYLELTGYGDGARPAL